MAEKSFEEEVQPITYELSGVSITAGNELVKEIAPFVAHTAQPGTTSQIGGFGGMFSLLAAGYTNSDITLVGAIDGVGTKLYLAHELNSHNSVGIDLVAMNVNDLVVQGAKPLFFLDCYTCAKLDVKVATAFIRGIASGCRAAECALIGGETAEMPGLFTKGISPKIQQQLNITDNGSIYDGVGAAIGAIAHGRPVLPLKDNMQAGDAIIGLASTGPHSNGFSLIRKILEKNGTDLHAKAPWDESKTIGETLLTPTKIYVKSVLKALETFNTTYPPSPTSSKRGNGRNRDKILIKGLAHITGGGLVENIPRIIPKRLLAHLDARKWTLPEVFRWLRRAAGDGGVTSVVDSFFAIANQVPKRGGLTDQEMARVWNCGIGMVLIVEQGHEEEIKNWFANYFEEEETIEASVIGNLLERWRPEDQACVISGTDTAWR